MRLIVQEDYASLSSWAAEYIAHRINDFGPTADRPFVLGLPTGSSPLGTYQELIRLYDEGRISFRHVVTFNMDEYAGLAADHPESYHSFMWEHLFSRIDIPADQVHILDGTADDLMQECRDYELAIEAAGGIRLFLGGIGADGHIAFNEPGSSLRSRTRVKSLTLDTIAANARFFGGDMDLVPKTALTVGVQTVMDADEVLILVNGLNKASALKKTIEEAVNHMCPCSIIQMHPKAIVVCDQKATYELKVGTVSYFNEIEAGH